MTEGELWTREQLERLRARRFSPRAVGRFLVESSRRSAQVRRERPEVARRAHAWMAAGAVAYVVAGRTRALGWWAPTALMLDWHLGMLETPDGRPRNLGPADALTLTRAWLVPIAAADPTPLVIVVGAATDVLDGVAARATGSTRAGRDLEGLVDACFAAAALRGAVGNGLLHRRVAATELTRLGAGAAFALVVYFGRAQPPPTDLVHAARATSALRMAGLLAATTGRRRAGNALVLTGSVGSLALLASAQSRCANQPPPSRSRNTTTLRPSSVTISQ